MAEEDTANDLDTLHAAEADASKIAETPQKTPNPTITNEVSPQTQTPKPQEQTNSSAPICPLCGKPLKWMEVGDNGFWNHDDGDLCKAVFTSLEEIEDTRKKQNLLRKAKEAQKKEQQKKDAEAAIINLNKSYEALQNKLTQQETLLNQIQNLMTTQQIELNTKLDELKALKKQTDIYRLVMEIEKVLNDTKDAITSIDTDFKKQTQAIQDNDKNTTTLIKQTNELQALAKKLDDLQITWKFTIKPITRQMIAEYITNAQEPYQKYYCVRNELTTVNNLINGILYIMKQTGIRLEAAEMRTATNEQKATIPQLREILSLERRLFNAWPTTIKYERENGQEHVIPEHKPEDVAPPKTEEETEDDSDL